MQYLDGIKPVCPNYHQHYYLRRVFNSFPQAYITDKVTMLKVNHPHVCEARIIIESEARNAHPSEPVQPTTRSAMVAAHS